MRAAFSCALLGAGLAAAQQYAGDTIPGTLPQVNGAEVAYFNIKDNTGKNDNLTLMNYYSLGTNGQRLDNSKLQRALIVIHGLLRDPWNYENDALNALDQATGFNPNVNRDTVAVMAPYFASGSDKDEAYPWDDSAKAGHGSTSNALVWKGSQWSAGADNQYPHNSRNTSSYYVMDELIRYFDDRSVFPNMKQIVLVGHSLGGQMLQRYAAIGETLNTRSPVTYWIGNPDSYSWMSTYRPLYIADCPEYDDYRSGYSEFSEYPMTYGQNIVDQGRTALAANLQTKQIAWARALRDMGDHSSDCGANTTGANRNERFFFFIKWWNPTCPDPAGDNCDTVDLIDVSHDNGQMFKSNAGQSRLFHDNFDGSGGRAYDYGYPRLQAGDDPYPDPAYEGTNGVTNFNTYAGGMTYQGCWSDHQSHDTLEKLMSDDQSTTIESCTQACLDAGWAIAGLENGSQCRCGNKALNSAALVVENSCYIACPGNNQEVCGGVDRLSLFSADAVQSG